MSVRESVLKSLSKGISNTTDLCDEVSSKAHCDSLTVINILSKLRREGKVEYYHEECRWAIAKKPTVKNKRKRRNS